MAEVPSMSKSAAETYAEACGSMGIQVDPKIREALEESNGTHVALSAMSLVCGTARPLVSGCLRTAAAL
eukprot:3778341-Pleurochrysis_carterae.AAC.2